MRYRVRLPATSANLGPGFDALGLAMGMYLEVEAEAAGEFSLEAEGRDAERVGALEGNVMLATYQELAAGSGGGVPALRLRVRNEIPLGMGCGSSAAAILAGVMLANRFGGLGMDGQAVLEEACLREGHPDNVAACFFGGMTVSAMVEGRVTAASVGRGLGWRLLLVLPERGEQGKGAKTEAARALLPESYVRADAVANVQATAVLVAAFALGRPELLAAGTRDRMHQPYRSGGAALLPRLLPLVGVGGIYAVTLSGAGPAVLLIADAAAELAGVVGQVREQAGEGVEVLVTEIAGGAAEE